MRPQTSAPTTPAALRALALGLGLLATAACAGGDITGPAAAAEARARLGGKPVGGTGDVTVQGGGNASGGGIEPSAVKGGVGAGGEF